MGVYTAAGGWPGSSWFSLRAWPWDPPAWSNLGFLTAWRLQGRQLLPGGSGLHHEASGETSRSYVASVTPPWKSLGESHTASLPSLVTVKPSQIQGVGIRLHP